MILHNSIIFDEPKTNRSKCWYCQALILKDDIRVNIVLKYRTERYHLLCYKPKIHEQITGKSCILNLDSSSMQLVRTWIADWNSQFKSSTSIDIRPKLLKKHLKLSKIPRIRMWLEILKYLPGIEVIKSISRVSRMFYSLSWNQEIFKYFCLFEFKSKETFKCHRSLYTEIYKEACYVCKSISPNIKYTRFSHTNRNLCKNCNSSFVAKGEIKDIWKVNPNKLPLKYIRMKYNRKSVETLWINRSVLNLRKKRKEKIFLVCRKKKNFPGIFEKIKLIDYCELDNLEKDENILKQLGGESEDLELLLYALGYIYQVMEKFSLKKIYEGFLKRIKLC